MDRVESKKYQLAQLELMNYVDYFCKTHNIKYFLYGGSLLGAIRHQGFIPWDVDIDIAMTRDNYERFKDECEKHADENLFYDHYSSNREHISPHAILRYKGTHVVEKPKKSNYHSSINGIYIDIMPIDEIPDSKYLYKRQQRRILFYRSLINYKLAIIHPGHTSTFAKTIKRTLSFLLRPFSYSFLCSKIDKEMVKYRGKGSGKMAVLIDKEGFSLIYDSKDYSDLVNHQFENYYFLIPKNYDSILKQKYGNYLILPSEDNRWEYVEKVLDYVDYGDESIFTFNKNKNNN